jgi:hypothetical protein
MAFAGLFIEIIVQCSADFLCKTDNLKGIELAKDYFT